MDSSPVITLPSDDELKSAVESENTYKNFKKKSNTKMRIIETPKEELKYREKKSDVLEKEALSCTTCGKDLKSFLGQKKFSYILPHPVLGVLLCKSCADFYGEGEFSVDEDGTDKYCRWCGQGGTLYLCAECNFGFCRACIKRNLQRSVLKDVEDDNWKCFACKPYPLWDLRSSCAAALKFIEEKRKSKRKLETRPLTTKSRKSKSLNDESEDEQVKKRGDVQKIKKSRDSSSDTLEKKKRKRNDSDSGESQEKKKKKRNSSAMSKDKKCLYDKEVDRKTTLDTKAAEIIASECKEQIDYFLKFLRAMSTEVKNVLREELAIENLLEYSGRKRLLKKMMMLEEMSCQSITQVCENFIVGYRKSFATSIENFEEDSSSSESENASRMAQGENKPNEKMEEQEHDDKLIKSKKKSANLSVHNFSDSDNSDKEICKNDTNKTEKNESEPDNSEEKLKSDCTNKTEKNESEPESSEEKLKSDSTNKTEKNESEPENYEEKLKSDSCEETILEKNKSDSDDSQNVSESSISKSAKNDAKKHKNNELTEQHSKSRKVTVKEHDSQEPETDSDASPHILQSEDPCENKETEKENENGSISDSDVEKEKEEHTTSSKSDVNINSSPNENNENQEKILITVDKTSVDLNEEETTRSNGKESKINDLECDENEENEEANNEDIQISDFELKVQKQKTKRKSAQDSTEENSGSDNDSLILKKQSKQKSSNSDASTKNMSSKEIIGKEDETDLLEEKNLTKYNSALNENESGESSDEDVISDSGSEKRHKKKKILDASSPQNSLSKSTGNNVLSACDEDDFVISERKTCGKKNSLSSCNLKNDKDSGSSDEENDDKKSTVSSCKGASIDSDKDTVVNSDAEIHSKGATPSTHQDALSDTDNNRGNLVSGEQIHSDEESDKADLKDGMETNSDAEAVNGADQNEDSASLKKRKFSKKTKCNEEDSKDEEKKAMLALLASSSSDEDHISFRKSRKTLAGEKVKEKCGPLSSKSFEYQKAHKNDQSGVFSDASEEMEVDSDNKICCESDGIYSEKLQKCSVVVHRLPEETFQKYKDSFSSSKNNQGKDSEKEIKK